jgi:predicted nucleic acid-binding Zn ribbon protein
MKDGSIEKDALELAKEVVFALFFMVVLALLLVWMGVLAWLG